MTKNHFNYIKITNQQHEKFLDFLSKAKEQYLDKVEKPIYMTESEMTLEKLNEIYTESVVYENVILNKSDLCMNTLVKEKPV